jgi:glycosyltransferase involved in cell wall biosynthesis
VILARNEERTIGRIVREVAPFADEVVVMDGNSTDRTASEARAAGAVVHADPGLGKGSAVRASFSLARGEVIVLMDADGSHDSRDIPRLAAPIQSDEADVVVGSRFAGGSDEIALDFAQLIRTIGNISMNIAINKRFGVGLTDTLNGFKAISKRVALRLPLKENRHTIEQELVIQALRHGYRVINVATHEYAREFGGSTINIWREWPIFIWCLFENLIQPRVQPSQEAASGASEQRPEQ